MAKFTVGVDMGGTNLRVGGYSADWQRLAFVAVPTRVSEGPAVVLADMAAAIRQVIDECGGVAELEGIGVGSPGPIELPEGRLLQPPNLPGFHALELKTELEKLLGLTVIIESDANAAALAEAHAGAGVKYNNDSLCMLTLGTGVGNGLIFDGRIWHGFRGMAGEAGHVSVWPDGIHCTCGNRGCLELFASATGIARMARETAYEGRSPRTRALIDRNVPVTARDVAQFAEENDEGALIVYDTVGRALGLSLAALVNTLNVPLYVIGGGASAAWPLFAPALFRELERASYVYRLTMPEDKMTFTPGMTNVVPAVLGTDSGLLGAAMVPRYQR
ncbi:ROK family protein [Acidipila sp. EB88]|uniref:ROK family protein n=1 Tax=Acidipila sp. EB88 TaxID=2305226 RepID=UPI000F5F3641|nr:ROK family protein [Acidipila sp. EB88]RRA47857.1 ROK family protein [Acidipila sp. EB88]